MSRRLIDADAYEHAVQGNPYVSDSMKTYVRCSIQSQPTIDAVPLDGSFLKMSRGDYLIYDRHWLYEHFDMEMDIQRSAMKSMGYEYVGKNTDAVRHGKWIYGNDFHWYTASCNRCGYQRRTDIKADRWNQWNYCPNCGCRMDAE